MWFALNRVQRKMPFHPLHEAAIKPRVRRPVAHPRGVTLSKKVVASRLRRRLLQPREDEIHLLPPHPHSDDLEGLDELVPELPHHLDIHGCV